MALYVAGMVTAVAFMALSIYWLFASYYDPREPIDLEDLGAVSFPISDRLEVASRRHEKPAALFLVCSAGGRIGLVLRVKLQVDESFLPAGTKGKVDIYVRGVDNGADFQPLLELIDREDLDTLVSPLMGAGELAPLVTAFGPSPPTKVSIMMWETGTYLNGTVDSRAITGFLTSCR
ncbi:MAG TPA: hypothetical protein VMF90_09660 [Rhizobiaceae bacterium]|nr:hypothetical protein [Rhizobiaceae bacterium]